MRFHETLKAAFLAARIERHWRRILRLRKQGSKLIADGVALNSERMLRLNRRLAHHGLLVQKKEAYYEAQFVPSLGGSR